MKTEQDDVESQNAQLPQILGFFPPELEAKFEFYNFGHALEILTQACHEEWSDLEDCFSALTIHVDDIMQAGGNESPIPKRIDDQLYPRGWREIRITGDLLIKLFPRRRAERNLQGKGCNGKVRRIDYMDGKVALPVEGQADYEPTWSTYANHTVAMAQ